MMNEKFPMAVPEIPVSDLTMASEYYKSNLGFDIDWGDEAGGIMGISQGDCRMFLTNTWFRTGYGTAGPSLIWLNVGSKDEVNALHEKWKSSKAKIVSAPESKPWGLYEFTAADLDGNLFRVFFDFGTGEKQVSPGK